MRVPSVWSWYCDSCVHAHRPLEIETVIELAHCGELAGSPKLMDDATRPRCRVHVPRRR
jgi:hypothetical protein